MFFRYRKMLSSSIKNRSQYGYSQQFNGIKKGNGLALVILLIILLLLSIFLIAPLLAILGQIFDDTYSDMSGWTALHHY